MSTCFSTLGLAAPLQRAVADLGYQNATSVQAEAIPAALRGTDWMVSSQTGSGKTAAFLLPCLHALIESGPEPMNAVLGPRVLVLCPTRELAQQVAAEAINLVKHVRGIRIATVVGGMPFGKQIASLRGASVVIATPGRLLDLYRRRQLRLDQVTRMVVDEADRMLDLGFSEDLEEINRLTIQRSQTLMYSATFAGRVMQLATNVMREPGRIELATAQDKHADISQTLHWADGIAHKKKLLDHWLRDAALEQAVVFASTQVDTEAIANELAAVGHSVAALHGAMPQTVRNRRIQSLRDGRIRILVATDVAARGIDVPNISHVINYGLPMKAEDYVHRIGRTGRAGRSGTAITLAEHRERYKIRDIERFTQQSITPSEIAGLEPTPYKPGPRRSGPPGRPGGFGGHARSGHGGGPRGSSDSARWGAPRKDHGHGGDFPTAHREGGSGWTEKPRHQTERPWTNDKPRHQGDRPQRGEWRAPQAAHPAAHQATHQPSERPQRSAERNFNRDERPFRQDDRPRHGNTEGAAYAGKRFSSERNEGFAGKARFERTDRAANEGFARNTGKPAGEGRPQRQWSDAPASSHDKAAAPPKRRWIA